MGKIRKYNGEARLIAILAVIAVVLAIIAIIPKAQSFSDDKVKQATDERYEEAAKRKLLVEYNQDQEERIFAYDGLTKQFVAPEDARNLVPYGNLAEHEGKVLLLKLFRGEIDIYWYTPKEIAEGKYAEETYR